MRIPRVGDIMAGFDERNMRKVPSAERAHERERRCYNCGATEKPCAEIGQCCLTVDRLEVRSREPARRRGSVGFFGAMGVAGAINPASFARCSE